MYDFCSSQMCEYMYRAFIQRIYDSPMPWIGVYVAAASLACSIAMAADVIHGFRHKKLWFPCKFFTVNAASLTLLAVAMKLPLDLTTAMGGRIDQLVKLSSSVFMTTVMGNFLTSFALMDNNTIFVNITALGILVITIVVNLCIQMSTVLLDYYMRGVVTLVIICMLVLFFTMSFSALAIPTIKRYLQSKYGELHEKASDGELEDTGKLPVHKLKELVEKYWVMAETGGPQFVMARSVICTDSGAICLLIFLFLTTAEFNLLWSLRTHFDTTVDSSYKWSTALILVIQTIGVVVGTIAPTIRWFTGLSFDYSKIRNNPQIDLKIENYWIESLVVWKERPLALHIRGRKFRKVVQDTKSLVLNLCIGIQVVIVVASKAVRLISIIPLSPFFLCYYYCKRLKSELINVSSASTNQGISEPKTGTEKDLNNYVLLLEGEEKLPKRILKNICDNMNKVIQEGRRQQPKHLMELLRKSNCFKGVTEFDSDKVPHMHSEKPLNCWTLPVVTLTSIAIALPNIENHMVDSLLSTVSEGLVYARHVEESLMSKGDLLNIKQAADFVWVGVELYRKWLDENLIKMALKFKTSKETLRRLTDIAEKSVAEFKRNNTGSLKNDNPMNWPIKVIAAHSMYRISQTLLIDYEDSNTQTDEKLFQQLSATIGDILRACLTNLPRVISTKCYCSAIEKREKSVRDAVCLLGEIEEILNILQQREFPSLNGDQLPYIDEWRTSMKHGNTSVPLSNSHNNEIVSSSSGDQLHIAIE